MRRGQEQARITNVRNLIPELSSWGPIWGSGGRICSGQEDRGDDDHLLLRLRRVFSRLPGPGQWRPLVRKKKRRWAESGVLVAWAGTET